jgi:phosphatidate cytidylyltransferase
MKSLALRIVSALFALALVGAAYYFGGNTGLFVFSCFAVWRVAFEYGRMVFDGRNANLGFATVSALLFISYFYWTDFFLILFSLVAALLLIFLTWLTSRGISLQKVVSMQSATILGLFYCVLLPVHVVKIIYVGPNAFWFPVYLCIIFAGDTFAYFVGLQWGRNKLLEAVSPKKTVEGAIGGTAGSLLVAYVIAQIWSVPLGPLLLGALGATLFGQMGDLFESLLKRVANVKDSGRFMPGHGGVMDRLDGVYMAAPFFYLVLKYYLD